MLIKTEAVEEAKDANEQSVETKLTNPFTIMLEIARACYLEEILFGKVDSVERIEIANFIEMASRLSAKELVEHL